MESLISADKDQIVRQQFQMSLRLRRAEQSLGELRATVEAIADRAPERAEQASRAHLAGVIQTLRDEGHRSLGRKPTVGRDTANVALATGLGSAVSRRRRPESAAIIRSARDGAT